MHCLNDLWCLVSAFLHGLYKQSLEAMHLPPQQHVKQSLHCLTISVHLLMSWQMARTITQVHLVSAMTGGIELSLKCNFTTSSKPNSTYCIILEHKLL